MVCVSGRRIGMEIMGALRTPSHKDYVQYKHTDECRLARWTARQSYQFMYSRPWPSVLAFYSHLINGTVSLSSLFPNASHFDSDFDDHKTQDKMLLLQQGEEEERSDSKSKSGRWARVTFKVVLAYNGASFDGWQKQPGLNTVQGLVERCLGQFVDERKAKLLKQKCLPVEACAVVAGRTDKGVTALRQVCSFYTWRKDIETQALEDAINSAAPGKLKVQSVSQVSRVFHPNFSASWRRYLYIFPLDNEEDRNNEENVENHGSDQHRDKDKMGCVDCNDESLEELEVGEKPWTFCVDRVNQLLRQLEGKLLSYKMFARDTKASRNEGPPTECFMYHARATEARLPCLADCVEGRRVMCVELVANRFLRKMVRVLVATAIREAAAGAGEDALLKLMDATCRRATAPPSPPDGLCLVNVGYTEFDPQICFIRQE